MGAVPGLARGLGHMAPTYVVGSRDRCPTALVARTLLPCYCSRMSDLKAELRRRSLARRDLIAPQEAHEAAASVARRASRWSPHCARAKLGAPPVVSVYWPIRSELQHAPAHRCARRRRLSRDVAGDAQGASSVGLSRLRAWRRPRQGAVRPIGAFGRQARIRPRYCVFAARRLRSPRLSARLWRRHL